MDEAAQLLCQMSQSLCSLSLLVRGKLPSSPQLNQVCDWNQDRRFQSYCFAFSTGLLTPSSTDKAK